MINSPIFFRIALLALVRPYDFPSITEVLSRIIQKYWPRRNLKKNTTKSYPCKYFMAFTLSLYIPIFQISNTSNVKPFQFSISMKNKTIVGIIPFVLERIQGNVKQTSRICRVNQTSRIYRLLCFSPANTRRTREFNVWLPSAWKH